ncbi:MAG: hypothetical protein ACI4JB_11325 [Porcipelethomonas sp.]
MPSISRVRIVNLRYNDDSRIIPDILFSFENSERQTVNTLLELENGGGKSVLVQLMLQPVIPNASVQKRKITDYFQKSSDHAYILVEWKLDRSSDHLLTGIAIAASQNTDENNESRSVRYFTFINHYDNFGDKLDIVNFPLTEMVGSRMNVAQFSKVRDMIKSSSRAKHFPSEKVKSYQTSLESFGIMHKEWNNILVKINEREGGIENFIEAYKTTDDLLNNFIIPGISNTNDRRDTESALETMFLNYAGSYADKNNKLQLREDISGFIGRLNEFQSTVRELWNLSDKSTHAVRELFDYIFSLRAFITELEGTIARLETQREKTENKKHHIKAEELSAMYHKYADELESVTEQAEKAENEMNEALENRDYYEHMIQVLEAAEIYQRLTKAQNDAEALSEQKRQLENQNMSGYSAQLRYSLFLATNHALSEADCKLSELDAEIAGKQSLRSDLTDEINSYKSEQSSVKTSADSLSGQRDLLDENISRGLERLNITITRMLDGSFDKEEIEDARSNFNNEIKSLSEKIQAIDKESDLLTARSMANQESLSELNTERQIISQDMQKINESLDAYCDKYKEVKGIVSGFSMADSYIFSDEPKKYISTHIAETGDELQKFRRRFEMLEEQLENAEKGTLHLPKSAIEYLASTGVSYQTGSAYLNQHEGLRTKLLENEPLVAFSIIAADHKARRAILEAVSYDSWIAAAIPVFTLEDIDRFTNASGENGYRFITAYSHEYFGDPASYSENISRMISAVKENISVLENRLSEQQKKQKILIDFDYSSDFEKNNNIRMDELKKRSEEITDESERLRSDLKSIAGRQSEIRNKLTDLSEKKSNVKLKIQQFEDICRDIERYYKIAAEISGKEQMLREIAGKLLSLQSELELLNNQLAELTEQKTVLENSCAEYRTVIADSKNTEQTEVIEKSYLQLKTEYDQLRSEYSDDMQSIEIRLSALRDEISELSRELDNTDVSQTEYSKTAYSSESLKAAKENKKKFDIIWQEKVENHSNLNARSVNLSEKRDDILEEISKFGSEVLPKSEISGDFGKRIQECKNEISEVSQKIDKTKDMLRIYSGDLSRAEKISLNKADPYPERKPVTLGLSENMIEDIRAKIESCANALKKAEAAALKQIDESMKPFADKNSLFMSVSASYREFIENSGSGDWYFTLNEKLEKDISTFESRRAQLDIALKDVEESRRQLVDNCLQRSRKLYEDLNLLTIKSKVKIFGQLRQMIKIDLPEVMEESTAPQINMNQYIDDCVKEFLSLPEHEDFKKRENLAHKYMGLRRLLNCYISKEDIPVRVYKIDRTPQSSTFRSWEHSLKANSGGEKFVVFFALVLSMMNYSRGISEALKQSSGVLILDNPFGPISSSHLLNPMFDIAKKFHIQLICLTHLGNAEIVRCFTNVYQLKLKVLPLSKMEVLEAKPMQHLEYAFYRSEQLSLLGADQSQPSLTGHAPLPKQSNGLQ